MTGQQVEEVPVIVIGASLVGLTLVSLLAKLGIKCLAVERHSSTAIHPRATLMMPRTMQVFKELGLYEKMAEESLKYYDKRTCIVTIESLAGKLLNEWMMDVNENIANVSATRRVFLTQQALEPLLRAKALESGGELRFATEMLDFAQDDEGVLVTVRNSETGEVYQIKSEFMVACDGFRSPTRQKLGIPMHGPGLLSRALTIYFEVLDKEKLAKLANAHYSGVIYVYNEAVRCFFRFDRAKTESFLVINSAGERGSEGSRFPGDSVTEEKAAEYLRAAIGDPSVAFRIRGISTWEAIADSPEHLQVGRIFLAGDAAHRMPPSGGFGGNTGVQDAHNLAWKLAAVLKGQASRALLDTYEEERLPIAKLTVENAFAHYVHRTEPSMSGLLENYKSECPMEHLELAYRYESQALFSGEIGSKTRLTEDPATAFATSGSVAHHVMIKIPQHSQELAISELFGNNFVFFSGPEGTAWGQALEAITKSRTRLPKIHSQPLEFQNDDALAQRYQVQRSGAFLVRPDGFVSWTRESSEGLDGDECQEILVAVTNRVLCLAS